MIEKFRLALIGSGLSLAAAGAVVAVTPTATVATTPDKASPTVVGEHTHLQFAQGTKGVEQPPAERGPSGSATTGKPLDPSNQADAPSPPPPAAVQRKPVERQWSGRNVRITTPDADVRIDPSRGAVRVRAPHTSVNVDPDRGRVRVVAPGVNLDLRW